MEKKILSNLSYDLIKEIFMYVDFDTINKLGLYLCNQLKLNEINNKELQLHFINNYAFIEFKIQKINPLIILNKLNYLIDNNKYIDVDYFKSLVINNNFKIKYFDIINIKSDNYIKLLKLLLKYTNYDFNYIFIFASKNGHLEIVKLLLSDKRVNSTYK